MRDVASPRLWSFSARSGCSCWPSLAAGVCSHSARQGCRLDFLNYHWYVAYALLHGRLARCRGLPISDVFQIADSRTVLSAGTLASSWIALFYLGTARLNIIPLYWMSRSALSRAPRAGTRCIGADRHGRQHGRLSMIRKTSYDQSLLSALCCRAWRC